MSDNDDTLPALWDSPLAPVHSDVLSVKHPVGPPIPEFCKSGQEAAERMAFVCVVLVIDHDLFPVFGSVTTVQVDFRRTRIGSDVGKAGKDAGDILPRHPFGANSFSQA